MKPKKMKRCETHALPGGGFLHIDRYILAIEIPKPPRRPKAKRHTEKLSEPGAKI